VKDMSEIGAFPLDACLGLPVLGAGTMIAGMWAMDGKEKSQNEHWTMTQLSLDFLSPTQVVTDNIDYAVHVRIDLQPEMSSNPQIGCEHPVEPKTRVICFSYAVERKKKSERTSALQQVLMYARSLSW
jgi:hypothetical protein